MILACPLLQSSAAPRQKSIRDFRYLFLILSDSVSDGVSNTAEESSGFVAVRGRVGCRAGHGGAAAAGREGRVSRAGGRLQTPLTTSPGTSPRLSRLILGFRHRHQLQHLQGCSSDQMSGVQLRVSPQDSFYN